MGHFPQCMELAQAIVELVCKLESTCQFVYITNKIRAQQGVTNVNAYINMMQITTSHVEESKLNRICRHKEKKNTSNETPHFECAQCKGQTRMTRCNVSYSIPTNARN